MRCCIACALLWRRGWGGGWGVPIHQVDIAHCNRHCISLQLSVKRDLGLSGPLAVGPVSPSPTFQADTGIVYAKICTLLAQMCETCPDKRKYAGRPEVRWLRNYANCDTYRTRFTNSPPQTRDSRVPLPIFFGSPSTLVGAATFHRHKNLVTAAVQLGS